MENQVLVVYGSKHGATTEIAEKIGQILVNAGLQVDVKAAKNVNNIDAYNAIVLGSGVYIGQWVKEAAKFLKANQESLIKKSLWIYSSGPTGDGDPIELVQGWTFPKNLQAVVDRALPIDVKVFHGSIDAGKMNFIEKWMIEKVGAALGDFRDWTEIESWAQGIADKLIQ